MDTPGLYGDVLFHHGFASAVEGGIEPDTSGRADPCGVRWSDLQYTAAQQVAPRSRADREDEK